MTSYFYSVKISVFKLKKVVEQIALVILIIKVCM